MGCPVSSNGASLVALFIDVFHPKGTVDSLSSQSEALSGVGTILSCPSQPVDTSCIGMVCSVSCLGSWLSITWGSRGTGVITQGVVGDA